MEFRLPEQLANKLVDYDQTLKQIKPKKEAKEVSTKLKRRTKLSFPCPDIFFDLTIEEIHSIYEEFCLSTIPNRYHLVRSAISPMSMRYLIAWHKCSQTKVEYWYCWKVGDQDCPIILRSWDECLEDTKYEEYRADSSLQHLRRAKQNPFTLGYKAERLRHEQFSSFITAITNQLALPNPPRYSDVKTPLGLYGAVKFFYQRYFKTEDEDSFYPANWLANQRIYGMTESHLDLRTNSTIVNSKFYQNEIRKEAERLKSNLLTERPQPDRILHKLSYIYLFLTVFPDEYDRSIHLYNQFAEYNFYSHWSTYPVFGKLDYVGSQLSAEFMKWLRSKLTPQMFANWILEEIEIKQKRTYDTTIQDTMDMLIKVWQRISYLTNPNPEYLKEPKRWRLQEVHDHYVGITLQMDNQMKNLPMDLIPEPVTFSTDLGEIRMFQPSTNHEVIRWGKAVRNCVGSAGYDERVLQRRAFLVFAELNGKPWLTSLLTLNMGMLHVGQTVSPFNANLETEQRNVYEKCLQEALGVCN